jgi:hypothetical protein
MTTALLVSKFWLGIGLIVLSFVIAQVTKVTFFLFITDSTYRSGSIVFYIFSWLMFFVGIWLVGREYYNSIRKYTTLKFYHESVVEGTKKVRKKK